MPAYSFCSLFLDSKNTTSILKFNLFIKTVPEKFLTRSKEFDRATLRFCVDRQGLKWYLSMVSNLLRI